MTQDFRLFRSALNSIMFLLIQRRKRSNLILQRTLNSIMFLLILFATVRAFLPSFLFKFHYVSINSDCSLCKKHISQDFKFHYVSINSARSKTRTFNLPNFKFHYVSINSKSNHPAHVKVQCFKFHYVSINSIGYYENPTGKDHL